jgi:hypothetical protein
MQNAPEYTYRLQWYIRVSMNAGNSEKGLLITGGKLPSRFSTVHRDLSGEVMS